MTISLAGQDEVGPDYPDRIDLPVMVLGLEPIPDAWEMPFHEHRKAQVMVATRGLITLETHAGLWVVPPQGAVWIPGGLTHRASSSGKPHGFVVFVEPGAAPGLPTQCCTMAITPFMQALLERVADHPQQYEHGSAQARLMAVLLDELIAAPPEWIHLPMPSESRLRRLASAMLGAPAERATLDVWAGRIGMSERNMSRLFSAETGLSVRRWRRQMHVVVALPMLAGGKTVQAVADELGYDSAGAFVTMFRKTVGAPPKRFLAERSTRLRGPGAEAQAQRW
ncbi:helix-turn-helix transcriptional regulator [Stenotrophomonas maltophilia]|uniref:AraC family transcriptional regulator n=1 Tax=Stenotrophomonas forensis TaxID=2871169 RepID=UPI0018D34E6B|nr:helix-turn-helix transcriptional regulator [Stenotrophomonas maltophilia]